MKTSEMGGQTPTTNKSAEKEFQLNRSTEIKESEPNKNIEILENFKHGFYTTSDKDAQYKEDIFKAAQEALGIKIVNDEETSNILGSKCIKYTSDNETAWGGKFDFDNKKWQVKWYNTKPFNNVREGDGVYPATIYFTEIDEETTAKTADNETPVEKEENIKSSDFDLRLINHLQELIKKINEEPDDQRKNSMWIEVDTIMRNCIDSDKFNGKHCFTGESKYFNGYIFYPNDKDYGLDRLNKLNIDKIYKKPDGSFGLINKNYLHDTLPDGYKIFYGDDSQHHKAWQYIAEQPDMLRQFIRKDNPEETNRKELAKTFLENNKECPKFDIYTKDIFDSSGVAHTETNEILLDNSKKRFLNADEQAKKNDLFFYWIYYSSYGGTQAEIRSLKHANIIDENKGREQGLGFLVEYAGGVIINDQLFQEIIILKNNTGENIKDSKDLNPFKFVLKKGEDKEGDKSSETKLYLSTSAPQISIAQLELPYQNNALLIELPFQSPEKGNPVEEATKEKIKQIVRKEISNNTKELINYLDVVKENLAMDGKTMFELVNFAKTGKTTSEIIYKTFEAICTKAYKVDNNFELNQTGKIITLKIPNEQKGLWIGKGGETIKKINKALNELHPGAKCIIK